MLRPVNQTITLGGVCPTCGTCPTCGHRPAPMVSPWAVPPFMPYIAPQPYYPMTTPLPTWSPHPVTTTTSAIRCAA